MEQFDIEKYMDRMLQELKKTFEENLLYVGLQGSYRLGEATEYSDIDVIVVLDHLGMEEMERYRELLKRVGSEEKSCGFLCGRQEIANWNRFEIGLLVHETKDYYGTLAALTPEYSKEDVRNYLKINVGNLYHMLCHSYVHGQPENNQKQLPHWYKQTFYILKGLYWFRTSEYLLPRKELEQHLSGQDLQVLQTANKMRRREYQYDFEESYRLLFDWCAKLLRTL